MTCVSKTTNLICKYTINNAIQFVAESIDKWYVITWYDYTAAKAAIELSAIKAHNSINSCLQKQQK